MNNQEGKIKEFTDLLSWKKAHDVVIMIYGITKLFPKSEVFGLMSQMQRSAVSITSNIAEGFGRQGMREKIQFYYTAQGSITELKNQLIISRDVKYISIENYDMIISKLEEAHRLLQGLIKKSKSLLSNS